MKGNVLRSGMLLLTMLCAGSIAMAEEAVHVGVATVLSGDLAGLGQNIMRTVQTYEKHSLRHKLVFEFEDAKINSTDGLRAYQALINLKKVDFLIGGTSSNGTMAGSTLMNSSKTVMITPVTGGSNVDKAGEYVFRIGNSDILNGYDQAEYFISHKFTRIALLTEQTEYTDDIAVHFKRKYMELGGMAAYDEVFNPGTSDFRPQITRILAAKPEAIFMPTQTGTALALFVKQLHDMGGFRGEIHTTFVAAPNEDARAIAGDLLKGVRYMAPKYDKNSPRLKEFFDWYRADHGVAPLIEFHTAGTVDALDMLQNYLDSVPKYDRAGFKDYLLTKIKDYHGLMGVYSFDAEGNANIGFTPAVIE